MEPVTPVAPSTFGAANKPVATVSVDVDPVDIHLLGYGARDVPPDRIVYDIAVPRILEMFAASGVRATFFMVARDAVAQAELIRTIAAAGHEIACHSMNHRPRFSRLTGADLVREVVGAKAALEEALGAPVAGFRAPNWDMTNRLLQELADAGYTYDASIVPSPVLSAARVALAAQARRLAPLRDSAVWPASMSRMAWTKRWGTEQLRVFPVSTSPRLRVPIYHTVRYQMSDDRFARHLDGFVQRGERLSYPLHAVDALGLHEDGIDSRLARHPGMGRPRDAKLDLMRQTLSEITSRFAAEPYAGLVAR